jgi:threonine/homoserine efflux transporter RhtA
MMRRRDRAVVGVIFLLTGLPAYAYADPTGGALFRVLMPMLGALWAMWMILANRIRNGVSALYRKLRGVETEETLD